MRQMSDNNNITGFSQLSKVRLGCLQQELAIIYYLGSCQIRKLLSIGQGDVSTTGGSHLNQSSSRRSPSPSNPESEYKSQSLLSEVLITVLQSTTIVL